MHNQLQSFLASPERPDDTMSYHELSGFLFSIACAPDLILPSEWLPLIFNEQDPSYSSLDQVKEINEKILELYNEINFQVVEGNVHLPDDCLIADNPEDNFSGLLGQWSTGFMFGHSWLFDLWDSYTPEELNEELGSCIMIMSYFADPKLAESYRKETTRKKISEKEMAQLVTKNLTKAMASYAHLGRSIYTVISERPDEPDQPFINEPKTGRNDPCPCGSGRKYKHCCLQ